MTEPYRKLPEEPTPAHLAPLLLGLALIAALLRAVDLLLLVVRPRLLLAYLRVISAQLRRTPYRETSFEKLHAARRAQKSVAELTYGETPVVTAARLLRAAGVGARSTVVDLGAGRGRVLLAARLLGARARGVEILEAHVAEVGPVLSAVGAELERGDATCASLEGATHIFLAWTCFSEVTRMKIQERLDSVPDGTRVVTLNWPIRGEGFAVVREGRALCSWGPTPYYVSERRRATADATRSP